MWWMKWWAMLPASNLTAGLIFELGFAAAEYDIRGDCGSANREPVTSSSYTARPWATGTSKLHGMVKNVAKRTKACPNAKSVWCDALSYIFLLWWQNTKRVVAQNAGKLEKTHLVLRTPMIQYTRFYTRHVTIGFVWPTQWVQRQCWWRPDRTTTPTKETRWWDKQEDVNSDKRESTTTIGSSSKYKRCVAAEIVRGNRA